MVRFIDTSSIVAGKFWSACGGSNNSENLCGRYLVHDSTESLIYSSTFTDEVSLHLYGASSTDHSLPKKTRDSLMRLMIAQERRLVHLPAQRVGVTSSCSHGSHENGVVFFAPVDQLMSIALIAPIKPNNSDISYRNLASFNHGIVVLFEFTDRGGIARWVARDVYFD
jgi:hypothetical protein